ncbi:MAG: hypothetical protein RIS64_940 [Bacteroidota bacterium]|jgi:hypothetical protein
MFAQIEPYIKKMISMKQTFFALLCTTFLFAACGGDGAAEKNAIDTNPTDVAEALHGFFSWYGDNADRIENNGFTAEQGGHRVLDEAKFKQYLVELKKSEYVSDELIADENRYYRACAKIWATEPTHKNSVGVTDRYLCDENAVVALYEKAPVTTIITGDRAKATMTVSPNNTHTFDLKKENGKWFLAKPSCGEPSVQY